MKKSELSEDLLSKILDVLGVFADEVAVPYASRSKRPEISWELLIRTLIEYDGTREGAPFLGMTDSALNTHISRHLKNLQSIKDSNAKWSVNLLSLVGYGRCSKCGIIDLKELVTSGKNNTCKKCVSIATISYREANPEKSKETSERYRLNNPEKVKQAYNTWADKNRGYLRSKDAKRKMALFKATPMYSYGDEDEQKVIDFYHNTPEGYHVDHIVPIQHPEVCGLHAISNLQYLPAGENISKSNKFTPYEVVFK